MSTTFARLGAAAALAIAFSAGALAQPGLNPQGSGSIEMDHSRMGGSTQQGQRPGGQAPTLNPQGGDAGPSMDHSRMGGANMNSPSGGTITGNPGSGPEVQHGHGPTPAPAATPRR